MTEVVRQDNDEIDRQIRQWHDGKYRLVAFGPWQKCGGEKCSHGLRLIYEHRETGELREHRIERPPVDDLMGIVRRTFESVWHTDSVQIDPFVDEETTNVST